MKEGFGELCNEGRRSRAKAEGVSLERPGR